MFSRRSFSSVAVIIPVYNVTSFLEAAIRSVLNQKYPDIEIIVVDDGSIPEEAENIRLICSKFDGVRLIRQDNKGPAHARDTGVENTSAEYIVFLDADDFLKPKAIAYLAKALQKNPNAVASYAGRASIKRCGKIVKPKRFSINKYPTGKEVLYALLRGYFPFAYGCICIRRKILCELPKNNHHVRLGEDWIQWCYLALAGNIIFAGRKIVVYRRRHDRNISSVFLDDPSAADEVHRVVFTDPLFIKEVGEERLSRLRKEREYLMNLSLAKKYIELSQKEKAAVYFKKITTSCLISAKNSQINIDL